MSTLFQSLFVSLFTSAICWPSLAQADPEEDQKKALGLKSSIIVRTAPSLANAESVKNLVQHAKANNIETLIVGAKQDEDHEFSSGTVFFHSSIAPMAYTDFDVLKSVLTEAHKENIKVLAWVPQFHDQVAFYKGGKNRNGYFWAMKRLVDGKVVDYTYTGNGDLPKNRTRDFFVNPCSNEVQAYERSIVNEIIEHYDVDGIVLDWIRFDNWEMDMGPTTIAAFRKTNTRWDPTKINFNNKDLKKNPALASWQQWRCQQIANHIKNIRADMKVRRPDLPLGIFVLPPEFIECGQDPALFKDYIDFISPMAYNKDWKYPLEWIFQNVIKDTQTKTAGQIAIIPTLDGPGVHSASEYKTILDGIKAGFPQINTCIYFKYQAWQEDELKQLPH